MEATYTALRPSSPEATAGPSQPPPRVPRLSRSKIYLNVVASILLVIGVLTFGKLADSVPHAVETWKERITYYTKPISGFTISKHAHYEYWREDFGQTPVPQTYGADGYDDFQLFHPEDSPSEVKSAVISQISSDRAIIIPTFPGHYEQALANIRSLQCLCNDIQHFDIVLVLSNRFEVIEFKKRLERFLRKPCPSPFGVHRIEDPKKPMPHLKYVNMYDILPPQFQLIDGVSENSTQPLLDRFDKFKYQSIKKFQTLRYYSYHSCLILDSEGIAVQSFSMRQIFDEYFREPTIWRSRPTWQGGEFLPREDTLGSARVLGRSIREFGDDYCTLESEHWIVERAIVEDMFEWVERAHGRNFWDVFTSGQYAFEITLYNLHIAARKLETTYSTFSKFKILEVERELIRFGLAPALKWRVHEGLPFGGVLEFVGTLLREPGSQPKLSKFLNHFKLRLVRLEELDFVDDITMRRFLLDTPVAMLTSGCPDVHRWWNHSFVDPEPVFARPPIDPEEEAFEIEMEDAH